MASFTFLENSILYTRSRARLMTASVWLDSGQLGPNLGRNLLDGPRFDLLQHYVDDAFQTCNVRFKRCDVRHDFFILIHSELLRCDHRRVTLEPAGTAMMGDGY